MADLVSVSKSPSGGIIIVQEDVDTYNLSSLSYTSNRNGVSLFNSSGNFIFKRKPDQFTINGVTGFTTNAQVVGALDALLLGSIGLATDEYDATSHKSDTVDLPEFGWAEAITAGTVKYTTERGKTHTKTVDVGWLSKCRVRRIWATGTAATININC